MMNKASNMIDDADNRIVGIGKQIRSKARGFEGWFNGHDTGYNGSGWGHGLRQTIVQKLNIDNKVGSLFEAVIASQLQFSEVYLVGDALEKVKKDPAMVKAQNNLLDQIREDERYKKEAFNNSAKFGVEFGGKRAPEPMEEQIKDPFNEKYADTWKVAVDELTWLLRHAAISYKADVDSRGNITIQFRLQDKLDLRPTEGRSGAYNTACEVLGIPYHDVLGGNDDMIIRAEWVIQQKVIEH